MNGSIVDNPEFNKDKFPTEIIFDRDDATLLISISKDALNLSPLRTVAESRGLEEKAETHLTILGSKTGKAIHHYIKSLSEEQGEKVLDGIEQIAQNIDWQVSFKPVCYYIQKEYKDPAPDQDTEAVPEVRSSIIQMVETQNIQEFYHRLKDLTGLEFELPPPHLTLFAGSTSQDKQQRGIGIYSEKDFQALNPELIKL